MNKQIWTLLGVTLIVSAVLAFVQAKNDQARPGTPAKRITIAVGGLHCQGCVEPVEKGLQQMPGVQGAKLDFKTGLATVQYVESKDPVSKLVLSIANIPHAMGKSMKYSGRLVLPLKANSKDASLDKARQAVAALPGVQKTELRKSSLYITFKPDSKGVSLTQIEQALAKAGVKRAAAQDADLVEEYAEHAEHSHSNGKGCCSAP